MNSMWNDFFDMVEDFLREIISHHSGCPTEDESKYNSKRILCKLTSKKKLAKKSGCEKKSCYCS